MLLFKVGERTLAIASTAVLARLLVPADFGLVAMAMSLIAGVELFTTFGFDIALIRDREAPRAAYDSAWTLGVIASVVCAAALLLLTVPTASFYHEPRLVTVIPILALGTLIMGFENIGTVAFRKDMRFGHEFRFLILKKVAAFCVTVPLAIAFRSYWALVAGMLVSRVAGVVLSYALHPYRPRFCLIERARLMHISKWLLANNLIFFLCARIPEFITGRLSGPRSLGLYTVGAELAYMPTTEIVAPINRAIYPGYAQHSGDLNHLVEIYLKIASVLWMLALPAAIGVWLVAEPLVQLLLGSQWGDAVPVIRILAVAAGLGVITGNQAYVYVAIGRPVLITALAGAQIAVILVAGISLSLAHGVTGMAYAIGLNAALALPASLYLFVRVTGVKTRRMLAAAWRPAIATAVMAGVVVLAVPQATAHIGSTKDALWIFIACVTIGAATFGATILLLWKLAGLPDGAERTAFELLRSRFPKPSANV